MYMIIYMGRGKSNTKTYFGVTRNNKDGVYDSSGNIIIDCIYDNGIRYIGNDLFRVSNGKYNKIKEKSYKYGIVNKDKEIIFPCAYTDLNIEMAKNITLIKIEKADEKNLIAYCNGKVIYSNNSYNNISHFDDETDYNIVTYYEDGVGYLLTETGKKYEIALESYFLGGINYIIKEDGKYGFCNTNNKIIDCDYDNAEEVFLMEYDHNDYGHGFYIEKGDKFGFINSKLDVAMPCIIDKKFLVDKNKGYIFSNNRCIVKSGDKYGVINENLEMVIPYTYDDIEVFGCLCEELPTTSYINKNYLKVKKNNKYGIVDVNNKEILACKYDEIKLIMDDNFFTARENGLINFINLNSGTAEVTNVVKDFEVEMIEYYYPDNFLIVQRKEKYGLYDARGNELLPCKYDLVWGYYPDDSGSNYGYIIFSLDGKCGLYSMELKMVIVPAVADEIGENWYDTYVYDIFKIGIKKDGKYGVYSEKGNIIPCIYDELILLFNDEGYVVKTNEMLGKIDMDGNIILSTKYDAIFPEKIENGHIVYMKNENKYYLIGKNEEILKEVQEEELKALKIDLETDMLYGNKTLDIYYEKD